MSWSLRSLERPQVLATRNCRSTNQSQAPLELLRTGSQPMEKDHGSSPCLLDPSLVLHTPVSWSSFSSLRECLSLERGQEAEGHLREGEWPGLWQEAFPSCSNTGDGGNTLQGWLASARGGWCSVCGHEANVNASRHLKTKLVLIIMIMIMLPPRITVQTPPERGQGHPGF